MSYSASGRVSASLPLHASPCIRPLTKTAGAATSLTKKCNDKSHGRVLYSKCALIFGRALALARCGLSRSQGRKANASRARPSLWGRFWKKLSFDVSLPLPAPAGSSRPFLFRHTSIVSTAEVRKLSRRRSASRGRGIQPSRTPQSSTRLYHQEHKGIPDAQNVPAVTFRRPADPARRHGLPPEAPLPEAAAVALQAQRRDRHVLRLPQRRHAHHAPTPARHRQRRRALLSRGLLHAPEREAPRHARPRTRPPHERARGSAAERGIGLTRTRRPGAPVHAAGEFPPAARRRYRRAS